MGGLNLEHRSGEKGGGQGRRYLPLEIIDAKDPRSDALSILMSLDYLLCRRGRNMQL